MVYILTTVQPTVKSILWLCLPLRLKRYVYMSVMGTYKGIFILKTLLQVREAENYNLLEQAGREEWVEWVSEAARAA